MNRTGLEHFIFYLHHGLPVICIQNKQINGVLCVLEVNSAFKSFRYKATVANIQIELSLVSNFHIKRVKFKEKATPTTCLHS